MTDGMGGMAVNFKLCHSVAVAAVCPGGMDVVGDARPKNGTLCVEVIEKIP